MVCGLKRAPPRESHRGERRAAQEESAEERGGKRRRGGAGKKEFKREGAPMVPGRLINYA